MAMYLASDSEITSIADAIRTKGGTSSALVFPTDFVTAIQNIPSGGGTDVSDTTAVAGDVLSGKYFYTSAGVKTQGTITSKAAQTYTPSTSDQTISSGQYLSGTQTILGDANLRPINIAKGVRIFNVLGTFTGGWEDISSDFSLTQLSGDSLIECAITDGNIVFVFGWIEDGGDSLLEITNSSYYPASSLVNYIMFDQDYVFAGSGPFDDSSYSWELMSPGVGDGYWAIVYSL